MPGSTTTPDRIDTRVIVPLRVAFRLRNGVGARVVGLSRLNGWPVHTPTDASPVPSRALAHGSGPMRFAIPSSWRTFTAYSLPVSPAHSAAPSIPVTICGGGVTQPMCHGATVGLSEPLHEPEPRMAWRITFDAAIFDVLVAPVEVGRLEACGVEPDPDTTTSASNFFHSRKQARTDTLTPVSLCNGQHIDRAPGPIGLSSRAALYFA